MINSMFQVKLTFLETLTVTYNSFTIVFTKMVTFIKNIYTTVSNV